MNHWTKYYIDGTQYTAEEDKIERGLHLGWRASPSNGMIGCELVHQDRVLSLWGPGEYWHSETYLSQMSLGVIQPTKIKKRIMKKILPSDRAFLISLSTSQLIVDLTGKILEANKMLPWIPIEDRAGQWLVLELDVRRHELRRYYAREKI